MKILMAVTNDLTTDQRMQKICRTLVSAGHQVTLIGRQLPNSLPLKEEPYEQKRLTCKFNKGILFYAEFNLRLWWNIKKLEADIFTANDLDTLPAMFFRTLFHRATLFYDAHEYFTEVPELKHKPLVRWVWNSIAKCMLWKAKKCYTVSESLQEKLKNRYHKEFLLIRNIPVNHKIPAIEIPKNDPPIILYQGALNTGRGLELLIRAIPKTTWQCIIIGDGDIKDELLALSKEVDRYNQITFLGKVEPGLLPTITRKADLGYNILENGMGESYLYSLSNKFFDYALAGVPSISSPWIEYVRYCEQFKCGWTLEPEESTLVSFLNQADVNSSLWMQYRANALKMMDSVSWSKESERLLDIYEL